MFSLLLSLLCLVFTYLFILVCFHLRFCRFTQHVLKRSSCPSLLSSYSLFWCCVTLWNNCHTPVTSHSCCSPMRMVKTSRIVLLASFQDFIENSHGWTGRFCSLCNNIFVLLDQGLLVFFSLQLLCVYSSARCFSVFICFWFPFPTCFRFCSSLWLTHSPTVSYNLSIPN